MLIRSPNARRNKWFHSQLILNYKLPHCSVPLQKPSRVNINNNISPVYENKLHLFEHRSRENFSPFNAKLNWNSLCQETFRFATEISLKTEINIGFSLDRTSDRLTQRYVNSRDHYSANIIFYSQQGQVCTASTQRVAHPLFNRVSSIDLRDWHRENWNSFQSTTWRKASKRTMQLKFSDVIKLVPVHADVQALLEKGRDGGMKNSAEGWERGVCIKGIALVRKLCANRMWIMKGTMRVTYLQGVPVEMTEKCRDIYDTPMPRLTFIDKFSLERFLPGHCADKRKTLWSAKGLANDSRLHPRWIARRSTGLPELSKQGVKFPMISNPECARSFVRCFYFQAQKDCKWNRGDV